MLNLQSSLCFNSATFFTYELIPKSDTKKYIEHFDKHATRQPLGGPSFSFTYYERDYTAVVHQWKIDNIEESWAIIRDFVHNTMDTTDQTRQYVDNFTLFLVELPYLPYNAIIIKSRLNASEISKVNSYNELLNILYPLNNYMDNFEGFLYKSEARGKYRPCYVKFEIEKTDLEITKQIKIIDKLEKTSKLKPGEELAQYFETSQLLRIAHYGKEQVDSDLLTVIHKQNSFSILGFLERRPEFLTYSNFEIIFRPTQRWFHWASNTILHGIGDDDFATYFHFVSIHLFHNYLGKQLDQFDSDFNDLVSKYSEIKTGNFQEQDTLYQEISDFSEKLFFIKSGLDLIDFALKYPLQSAITNLPNFNLLSKVQYSYKKFSSSGVLKATFQGAKISMNNICKRLDIIQKKGDALKDKFEKKILFENSQTSIKTQKNMERQSKGIIIVSLITLVFTSGLYFLGYLSYTK